MWNTWSNMHIYIYMYAYHRSTCPEFEWVVACNGMTPWHSTVNQHKFPQEKLMYGKITQLFVGAMANLLLILLASRSFFLSLPGCACWLATDKVPLARGFLKILDSCIETIPSIWILPKILKFIKFSSVQNYHQVMPSVCFILTSCRRAMASIHRHSAIDGIVLLKVTMSGLESNFRPWDMKPWWNWTQIGSFLRYSSWWLFLTGWCSTPT